MKCLYSNSFIKLNTFIINKQKYDFLKVDKDLAQKSYI